MPRPLYAPALPAALLRSLHRAAQARKQPMTRLLAELVKEGLSRLDQEDGSSVCIRCIADGLDHGVCPTCAFKESRKRLDSAMRPSPDARPSKEVP